MGALYLELVEASAVAMVTVIIIAGTGALCAKYPKEPRPLLGPDARRDIGDLSLKVLWPCLTVASVGPTIHLGQLADVGELMVWCLLSIGGAGLLSYFFSKALKLDPLFAAAFTLAGAFGNAGALPMLMMDSLCVQPVVLTNMDSYEMCVETSNGLIIVFTMAWIFVMFGFAVPLIKEIARVEQEKKDGAENKEKEVENGQREGKSFAGGTAISVRELEMSLQGGGEGGESSVDRLPSSPATERKEHQQKGGRASRGVCSQILAACWATTRTPTTAACYLGLAVGLCRPVSDALFTGTGFLASGGRTLRTIGTPGILLMTLVTGAALFFTDESAAAPTEGGPQAEAQDEQEEDGGNDDGDNNDRRKKKPPTLPPLGGPARGLGSGVSPWTVAALCFVRLVAVPAVGFTITWLAMRQGLFGSSKEDGLRALVVCVEWAVPSAQTAVVLMATLQYHDLARRMAVMYLFMYPLSMVTLTAWTSLALLLVERYIWDDDGGGGE
jgi:predicted permease